MLALLLNRYVSIPIFGSISFCLGSIISIVGLIALGLRSGLLIALSAAIGLFLNSNEALVFILYPAEILVLHLLLQRKVFLILAAVLFWLCIGLPVYYIATQYFGADKNSPVELQQLIMLGQFINALFNAAVALLIKQLVGRYCSLHNQEQKPSMANQIFELVMVCIIIPAIIMTIIQSKSIAREFEVQKTILLEERASKIAALTQLYLIMHTESVKSLAKIITEKSNNQEDIQQPLFDWQNQYSSFITMLITDKDGLILNGAPYSAFKSLQSSRQAPRGVADRPYFYIPKQTGSNFVSDVFQGRGFGNDPIVAISMPYTNAEGRFNGVVEGSLNLPDMRKLEISSSDSNEFLVIVDGNNKVVYSSKELGLQALSKFEEDITSLEFTENLPLLKLMDTVYLFDKESTVQNWTIYSISKASALIKSYNNNLYKLMLTFVIVLIFGGFITSLIIKILTKPLKALIDVYVREASRNELVSLELSNQEMDALRKQLLVEQDKRIEHQLQLENELKHKTNELAVADEKNRKLKHRNS